MFGRLAAALSPAKARSLTAAVTRWAALALAIGVAATLIVGELARERAADNLADFSLIDFLREEIEPALATCPTADEACLIQIYTNESGGLWRMVDAAGAEHRSFSFGVSGFAALSPNCEPRDRRRVDAFSVYTCAPTGDVPSALIYRVAVRSASGGGEAVVALELPSWRRMAERSSQHLVAGRSFHMAIVAMSIALIVVIALSVWLLLRGLRRNLTALGAELEAFRRGETPRVRGRYPSEIQAVVASLNSALEQNAGLVARQKRNVNKMAHDLRHQLVNVDVAARSGETEALTSELQTLGALAERYLTLVDWVGPTEGVAASDLAETLEGVRKAFARRLRVEPIDIVVDCPPGLRVRAHPADLKIILFNLAGNAHKYARSRMRLRGAANGEGVALIVEDDGPGIPEEDRAQALNWGVRLDAAAPGSGFGLSIVAEQVHELYGGRTRLEESPLGGLAAIVELPR